MDGVMSNRPYALIVILATLCVLLIGCNSNSNKKLPFTLQTAYGNKIEQVNGIIIVNGSTGERKEIDDEQAIHQWVDQVRDIKLTPLADQEKRDGFLYAITFFEHEAELFGFSLGYIDGVYVQVDEEMLALTEALFKAH